MRSNSKNSDYVRESIIDSMFLMKSYLEYEKKYRVKILYSQ